MPDVREKPVFVCGEYRIDILRRRLFVGENALSVNARAFDVLAELVRNAGNIVSKDDLMSAVWQDTIVEENNLTQQISTLRKLFNERAGDHRFIATVPGRGYCFVGSVAEFVPEIQQSFLIADSRTSSLTIDISNPNSEKQIGSMSIDRAAIRGSAIAAIYVVVVCFSALIFGGEPSVQNALPRSVGILNFRTLGADADRYGDGFSYTLRAKLGSLDDVTVRPDANPSPETDLLALGRRMGVDVVLAGSVQKENERIRVAVEMVDVRSERIIWGKTFDDRVEHIFELQDSIAAEVLRSLRGSRRSSLQGRYLGTNDDMARESGLNTANNGVRFVSFSTVSPA